MLTRNSRLGSLGPNWEFVFAKQAQVHEASPNRAGGVCACSEVPQGGPGQILVKLLGFGPLKHKNIVFLHRANNFFLYHIKLSISLK